MADRDQAITLLLVDTGIRTQELCHINTADLNLQVNNIKVRRIGLVSGFCSSGLSFAPGSAKRSDSASRRAPLPIANGSRHHGP